MKVIKTFVLLTLLIISIIGHTSQVIPPGAILEIIAKNNLTVKELKTNWIIKKSNLIKNSSEKELLETLELLTNIDINSVNPDLWENKIQKVKTKDGLDLEVKFSYTNYEYGQNDIALSGRYNLDSVLIAKTPTE